MSPIKPSIYNQIYEGIGNYTGISNFSCSFSLLSQKKILHSSIEFGKGLGKLAIIAFSIYGLRSAISYPYQNTGDNLCVNTSNVNELLSIARNYEQGQGLEKSSEKACFCYNKYFEKFNTSVTAPLKGPEIEETIVANNQTLNEAVQSTSRTFKKEKKAEQSDPKVEQSDPNAFEYYKNSADEGDRDAQFMIAQWFKKGEKVQQSDSQALVYYKKAADQGHIEAQYQVGKLALFAASKSDKREFFTYLKKAADQGHIDAQSEVAYLFYAGIGVEKSIIKYIDYTLKAANQGSASALRRIGDWHAHGAMDHSMCGDYSIPHSDEIAFDYYKQAADKGYSDAQYLVGRYFAGGWGNQKQSDTMAFQYFKKAADQGHFEAQDWVGRSYEKGSGVEQSDTEAYKYYKKVYDRSEFFASYEATSFVKKWLAEGKG